MRFVKIVISGVILALLVGCYTIVLPPPGAENYYDSDPYGVETRQVYGTSIGHGGYWDPWWQPMYPMAYYGNLPYYDPYYYYAYDYGNYYVPRPIEIDDEDPARGFGRGDHLSTQGEHEYKTSLPGAGLLGTSVGSAGTSGNNTVVPKEDRPKATRTVTPKPPDLGREVKQSKPKAVKPPPPKKSSNKSTKKTGSDSSTRRKR